MNENDNRPGMRIGVVEGDDNIGERFSETGTPVPTSPINNEEDDEVAEFAALLAAIAELKDDDTEVEHVDLETFKQWRRS